MQALAEPEMQARVTPQARRLLKMRVSELDARVIELLRKYLEELGS